MDTLLNGKWRVTRVNRETGRIITTPWESNAITEEGQNRFCRQVTGLDNAPMNQSTTKLVLKDGNGATIKTLDATDNQGNPQAPVHSGRTVTWTFADISIDTYTVASVEIQRSGSPSYTFSIANPSFSGGNAKPNSENWIYEYELTLDGGENFDLQYDGSPPAPGLERMLRHFTGNLSAAWAGLTTRLYIFDATWEDGSPRPNPATSLEIDSGYPQVTDNVITWRYTTTGANVLWRNVELAQDLSGGPYVLGWLPVNRTKESPATWEYTLTLTVN